MRKTTLVALWASALWGAAATGGAAIAADWKPEKAVELVAQSAPGGGTDQTARLIQKILQERQLLDQPVSVINKPGGGGNIALTYLSQRPADGYTLEVVTALLVTNHILGKSRFRPSDFTLLTVLNSEYVAFAVRADSPIRNAKDLLGVLGSDPASLSVAVGTSLGGANHMSMALATRAAGGDPKSLKLVVFKSSADSATALLGGHVGMVVSSASLLAPHVRSGALRAIAMTSPRRVGGPFASVPTWKELGQDIVVDNFRALAGPAGMEPAQIAFWGEALSKVMASDAWKSNAERRLWDTGYLDSQATSKYFEEQYAASHRVLSDLNMAKR